jgi:hypothetical protein
MSAERFLEKPEAVSRVVRPTCGLLQGGTYTSAAATDLRKRFDEIRASMLDFSGPSLRELKARKRK